MDAYNESHRLLLILNEDKEKWENKKKNVEAKAKEISTEKESLHASLNTAFFVRRTWRRRCWISLLRQPTSDVYFKCANEKILFLYPNLYLSQMDFLKAFYGCELVDEETMASLKSSAHIRDTQG